MSATELREIEKKRHSQSSKSSEHEIRGRGDELAETDDPAVQFIQPNHSDVKLDVDAPKADFTGLTKEELMEFANDPFWKRVRLVLFILFWILWAAMLVAAIIIIVLTPKCPTIPKQTYWQKSPGYILDVSKFKDTDGNGIGDIKGVTEKIKYLSSKAGFIVLQSVIAGSLGDSVVRSPAITNFKAVDERIGSLDDVKALLKKCRQTNLKSVIQFYPHTGMTHPWFQKALKSDKKYQKYYYWSKSGDSKMVNRIGENVWNKVPNGYFWSSLHKSVPALDLKESSLLAELKDSVQFWLEQGFDGIFIDDVAFLAPEVNTEDVGKGKPVASMSGNLRKWYSTGHNGQLYTQGSIEFIQKVRAWVDEIKEKSDRERLFLVSTGNTGLRHSRNKTRKYLGDSKMPGAHSVVLFDLVKSQGTKVTKPTSKSSVQDRINYALSDGPEETTFITQSPSGPRSTDATTTYLSLLLPGTTLSLYGEEIGMKGYDSIPGKSTSKVPYWYLTTAALADAGYADDVMDRYNVPMQWHSRGGFSNTSSMKFPDTNVMSMSTLGRGTTRYNLFEDLVRLRKEPSLNWGDLTWIETEKEKQPNYYIFSRLAAGFPKYLAVLIEPHMKSGGIARDLSFFCPKANAKLVFPSNDEFDDKKLPMKNIYFRYNSKGSIYLFECV